MTEQSTDKKPSNALRPDPLFKDVTRTAALAAGLELLTIELPQLLRADLVLTVPPDKDLSGTLFEFLSPYSILEFKSENDDFDQAELIKNLARSLLFLSKNQAVTYNQLLTVFVCAKHPDSVLEHLAAEISPIESDPSRPWLLHSHFGPLKITIVVCRLLPLEKRYYDWLLFAPTGSVKWHEFVKILVRNGEKAFLEQVKNLRPKEFTLMTPEITEMLKTLSPEERAQHEKDWFGLIEAELLASEDLNQDALSKLLTKLRPETLTANLTPEQRKKLLELLSQPDNQNQKPE
jgi:hypothetical protein